MTNRRKKGAYKHILETSLKAVEFSPKEFSKMNGLRSQNAIICVHANYVSCRPTRKTIPVLVKVRVKDKN